MLKKTNYDPNNRNLFDFESNIKNGLEFLKNRNFFENISKREFFDKIFSYPIYGSNPEFDSKETGLLMNNNPEIGHMYKGNVIMEVVKEIPLDKPIIAGESFTPLPSENFTDLNCYWKIYIKFYELNMFKKVKSSNLKIAFCCGNNNLVFDVIKGN